MTRVLANISMSLDGYVAGPNPSTEEPLGEGGERNVDSEVIEQVTQGVGAYIMGRRMFDGREGPLDESWKGWWGDDPPYHTPVFVLTHHPREPLEMEGGTTFVFVNDGIESALSQARAAAGQANIAAAGGGSVVQQFLAAGLLDELFLHIAPVVLGGGVPLFANLGDTRLEPVEAFTSPAVTHVRYVARR